MNFPKNDKNSHKKSPILVNKFNFYFGVKIQSVFRKKNPQQIKVNFHAKIGSWYS